MRRSFAASALLHLLLAALLVAVGTLGRELPPQDMPISVEIVADTELAEPSPLPPKAPAAATAPKPPQQAATPAPPPPAPKAPVKPEPAKVAEKPPEPTPKAELSPPPPEPKEPEPTPSKPAQAVEKPKPEPEKPKPEPEKPKPAAAKPRPPEPTKPAPEKPTEAAKPAPPKLEKPKTPPAPVQAESDFDALLRSVEQTPKREKAPETREGKGSSAEAGGTGQPSTAKVAQINASLLAASISRQITPCWNIPVAAQGIGGLRAELNIVMGPDGSVQSVVPTDAARMSRDPVFRAFAESAVRAVRACSPLKLPPESYQLWRNIIFNFDPSRMTG